MKNEKIITTVKFPLDVNFVAAPVVDSRGKVIAMEIFPRFSIFETESNVFFPQKWLYSKSSLNDKHNLLILTIDAISKQEKFFKENNIFCTLNADRDIADMICTMSDVKSQLTNMTFIRLEINENFSATNGGINDPLLSMLGRDFILWLDNFGSGKANLAALQSGIFETVKIDRRFFCEHAERPLWHVVLREIRRYASSIVVEGVENLTQIEKLVGVVDGMQGSFFPFLSLDAPFTEDAITNNSIFK